MAVQKEDIRDKEEVVVYAKGMGGGTAWLIREPNGFQCLEHEVVGKVRRWEVAETGTRWEVKKENGL